VWKSSIDGYREAWNRIYGNQEKPDLGAIQRAMANRISPTDFMYSLKNRADYTRSETYLSNSATLQKSYEAIYGKADTNGMELIHQAVLAGWDPTQFETYLRKQPQYTQSSEYKAKLVSFLSALGLVTGGEPTLTPGVAGLPGSSLAPGAPPPDRRVPYPTSGPQSIGVTGNSAVGEPGAPITPFMPAANPGV
jgi:hypothetical protein